ncbi:MAG: DUF2169 domain-containing protein [Desulfobacterales bacterium]|jgi:hypothetical protein|nr:DUF2169 domain-containing protein [Desulfobacterales bacterium]
MDLDNGTPFPAVFMNTIISEERMLGAVVVKAVFRIKDNALVSDEGPPWPVGGMPFKTEYGDLEGETPFLRDGADLIVLGNAYPSQDTAGFVNVTIQAGKFAYGINVFGDRTWVRHRPDEPLIPSTPEPFSCIPLVWERAYGGKAQVDAGEMPFAANPAGRGFFIEESAAEGGLLPNLEDPDHPIQTWQDQPDPRAPGPYPKEWSLRAHRAAEFNTEGPVPRLIKLKPAYFNNANPHLVLKPAPTPGEIIMVNNVQPKGGGCQFAIPELSFHVYVQLQDRPYVFPAHLDSIILLTEEKRVIFGYRCVFRYRMVPLERRIAVLRTGPAPLAPPPEYFIQWAEPEMKVPAYE